MSAPTWNCPKCGETLEATFETCWKCGTSPAGIASEKPEFFDADSAKHLQPIRAKRISGWRIAFLVFLGAFLFKLVEALYRSEK